MKSIIYNLTIICAVVFLSTSIFSQQSLKVSSGCILEVSSEKFIHYSKPPQEFLKRGQTSQFELTFVNTTSEQEAAVRFAADIWSSILVSNVPIKIIITFYPLPNFLGQCISNIVKDYPGAPMNDTWYVSALANAITGIDQQPNDYDMDIFFSSTAPWYYGVDGNAGGNKFDLVSTALHEMGHGLGYFGLGYADNGIGSIGHISPDLITRPIIFEFPELNGLSTNYDNQIVNGVNEHITDTTIFANPSEALGSLFVSNNLFFNGESALAANNNNPVKLFAVNPFKFASSLLHLDEYTYPPGNINSLMTPDAALGESNHNPGPISIGIFEDLGWTINDSVTVGIDEVDFKPSILTLTQNYPNPFNPTTEIEYSIPELKSNDNGNIFVNLEVYNSLGQKVASLVEAIQPPGNYKVHFNGSNLPSGIYFYTLMVEGDFYQTKKMLLMK